MSEPICPKCKQPRPKGWFKDMRKRQAENISKALKNSDIAGRKRNVDYKKIYELKELGSSISMICNALGVSKGSVQHALRLKRNGRKK